VTASGIPARLVAKEVRILLGPWIGAAAVILLPAFYRMPAMLGGISILAIWIAAPLIGALSMGHEYSNRTLSTLLMLPISRARIFAAKWGVMAGALVALAFIGYIFVLRRMPMPNPWTMAWPVLFGVCVVPWLTMLTRNPLGGAVFTLVVAIGLRMLGWVVYWFWGGAATEDIATAVGSVIVCTVAAVASWRAFRRLEANDGPEPDLELPRWMRLRTPAVSRPAPVTRRSAVRQLIAKELRLQQIAFVVAGAYVCGWIAVLRTEPGPVFDMWTFSYTALLGLLVGSVGSAEERQLGTLEWQLLLPLAAWKQWAVKVAVVAAIAVGLGIGLPMALRWLHPAVSRFGMRGMYAGAVVLFAAGSLYVSSLSRSSLLALVTTLGGGIVMSVALPSLDAQLSRGADHLVVALTRGVAPSADYVNRTLVYRTLPGWIGDLWTVVVIAVFCGVAVALAFANHRTADRSSGRVLRQVLGLAGGVAAVCFIASCVNVIIGRFW
jgi:hypothetical protein